MNANDSLLSVSDLVVRYGTLNALQRVSFGIKRGSTTAIVGTNGSGKSTLARSLAGLVRPASGHVHFDGQDITGLPPYKIRRLGVVYLPEERGVSRSLSVLDNLRLATTLIKGRAEKQEAIDKAVALFPVLGSRQQRARADPFRWRAADACTGESAHHPAQVAHRRRDVPRARSEDGRRRVPESRRGSRGRSQHPAHRTVRSSSLGLCR